MYIYIPQKSSHDPDIIYKLFTTEFRMVKIGG